MQQDFALFSILLCFFLIYILCVWVFACMYICMSQACLVFLASKHSLEWPSQAWLWPTLLAHWLTSSYKFCLQKLPWKCTVMSQSIDRQIDLWNFSLRVRASNRVKAQSKHSIHTWWLTDDQLVMLSRKFFPWQMVYEWCSSKKYFNLKILDFLF